MGLSRRNIMAQQAKVTRAMGQQITLLCRNEGTPSTTTPLDIVAADTANPATPDSTYGLYAQVSYEPSNFEFGEGGHTFLKKAKVEITADWAQQVITCYAVQFSDGSVLLKKGQRLNDTGTVYILELEGYIKSNQ